MLALGGGSLVILRESAILRGHVTCVLFKSHEVSSNHKLHSLKLTFGTSKLDGWETILSFLGVGLFSGAMMAMLVSGRVEV